jgi:hypothetical protein
VDLVWGPMWMRFELKGSEWVWLVEMVEMLDRILPVTWSLTQ